MVEAVRDRRYDGPGVSNHAKTDAGRRDIGIDAKVAAELTAWKLQQKPEHRQADSLVVATRRGGPSSASNFLAREFRPARKRSPQGIPNINQ